MRRAFRFTVACLLLAGSAQALRAQTPVITALGEARTVSLMSAIASFCPPVIPTDKPYAERFSEAAAIVGRQLAKPKQWKALVTAEGKRRYAEVAVTGPQKWCEDQRRYVRESGDTTLFP